jgi:hypothetical protein
MRHTTLALTVALIAIPTVARAQAPVVANGGFEQNGYEGWTLTKDATSGTYATLGVLADGDTVAYGGSMYDYRDGVNVQEYSSSLPLTAAATEGTHVAVWLQNGPAATRMYQTVTLPAAPVTVSWDLAYHDTWGTFASDQRVRVVLRDPQSDAILATLFETKAGDPLVTSMTHYSVDASSYAGQTVRLDVVLDVREHFLQTELDNLRVDGAPEPSGPIGHALAGDRAQGVDEVEPPVGCSAASHGGGGTLAVTVLAFAFAMGRSRSRRRRSRPWRR